ncbi:hypothetical protein QF040_004992 [Variovorax sp. W2I14]
MNTGSATMQRSACQRTSDFDAASHAIDLDAAAQLGDARDDLPRAQALAERHSQLLGEPAVAFGPGEHAVAFGVRIVGAAARIARRMEAVPAREVMNAGPGRHLFDARAVVVAAAVVEVPAQLQVAETFAVEPARKGDGVERQQLGRDGHLERRNGEVRRVLQRVDPLRELAVLRQRVDTRAMHGQQAVLPFAVKEKALLRAVAKGALVVFPAARHALAKAQVLQQVLHLARIVTGHRQVVRAERAGDAVDHAAARIAAGTVFEFEHSEVFDAREPQGTRGCKTSDAATGDHHPRALHGGGRLAPERAVAHGMSTGDVDAGEAAFDGWWHLAASQRQGARRTCHAEKIAPLHDEG